MLTHLIDWSQADWPIRNHSIEGLPVRTGGANTCQACSDVVSRSTYRHRISPVGGPLACLDRTDSGCYLGLSGPDPCGKWFLPRAVGVFHVRILLIDRTELICIHHTAASLLQELTTKRTIHMEERTEPQHTTITCTWWLVKRARLQLHTVNPSTESCGHR